MSDELMTGLTKGTCADAARRVPQVFGVFSNIGIRLSVNVPMFSPHHQSRRMLSGRAQSSADPTSNVNFDESAVSFFERTQILARRNPPPSNPPALPGWPSIRSTRRARVIKNEAAVTLLELSLAHGQFRRSCVISLHSHRMDPHTRSLTN